MSDYYRYPPEPDFPQERVLSRELVSTESPSLTLRPYQAEARRAFDRGLRRQLRVWHRRAGKDIEALDLAGREMQRNPGNYWHLYPTHTQARRSIWNGIDPRARVKFLDRAFPQELRKSTLKQDMTIEYKNGSIWQLCGSDRYDSLVGANPAGVVVSEWALCDPRAWDYIRPILRENGGWIIFITTLRGKNHAYRMMQKLRDHPDWYVDVRTVDDTTDINGKPILSPADIEAERSEGMSEAMIRQEYYCDPIASLPGAIYGKSFDSLVEMQRLGNFPYDSSRPVIAAWSLENHDQYTATFWQSRGSASTLVGCASYPFESLGDCIDQAKHELPWRYIARHIIPPATPAEVVEAFENRGEITDAAPELETPYSTTREQLATFYIDNEPRSWTDNEPNNENVVDSLLGYRFSPARAGQSFTNEPVNSWEKHYARSVEVFATHRASEPLEVGGWHNAPSTEAHDSRVI